MAKYEYQHVEVKTGIWELSGKIPPSCFAELDRLGNEGWELVNVVRMQRLFGRTDYVYFILKREISG